MSKAPFVRTAHGLSNQATFLGVDMVVFAEGGIRAFTFDEVEQGSDNGETLDASFWRAVIERFIPQNLQVHIKSIGSKTTVSAIAQLVATDAVTKVVAAMDRDLDNIRGAIFSHRNVIYTIGYSWENDVWTSDTCVKVIESILHDRASRIAAREQIERFFVDLERCFSTAVRFDRSLAAANQNPISREGLIEAVRPAPPHPPSLQRTDLAALIRDTRSKFPYVKIHPSKTEILLDLHGHTLAKASCHLVRSILLNANHKLSNASITSMALTQFVNDSSHPSMPLYRAPVENLRW